MTDSIPQDDVPLKRCHTCPEGQQWHPATTEFFYRDKGRPDGFEYNCKSCRYTPHPAMRKPSIPSNKRLCMRCNQVKTLADFSKNVTSVDGYRTWCKKCDVTYNQEYASSHKDKIRGQRQRHKLRHPRPPRVRKQRNIEHERKMHRIRSRRYREKHPELCNERVRIIYYRTDRAKHRAKCQRWREANREHFRKMNLAHEHKRRARKKQVQGTHTAAQIAEQLKRQHYRCYYAKCGFAKFKRIKENGKWKYDYEVEHTFPISRVAGTDIPANDMSYLVLSCPSCNGSKGNKYPWEWYEGGRLL